FSSSHCAGDPRALHPFPTRRSSDLRRGPLLSHDSSCGQRPRRLSRLLGRRAVPAGARGLRAVNCGAMEATLPIESSEPDRTRLECDVVIVGAALVGASLAAALRPSGLRIVLLDAEQPAAAATEGWDSRIYAVSPGSRDFLATVGAWQRIPDERIARVDAMQVYG